MGPATSSPIAHIPEEILESFNAPFRWAFVGPTTRDEEAVACKLATPRLDVLLSVMDTLRSDGIYPEFQGMEAHNCRLRNQISLLSNQTTPQNTEEWGNSLLPLGIEANREKGDFSQMFSEHDLRNAHDQQASDIPQSIGHDTEERRTTETNVQVSISALFDNHAAENEETLNMAAAKFVHRKIGILRKSKSNSLQVLAESYPDLFGISSIDKGHLPLVTLSDRTSHIL